jgi:hypothetical protein
VIRAKTGAALAGALAVAGLLAAAVLASAPEPVPAPDSPPWIGELLWGERAIEAIAQAFILLAGTFAIVLLVPSRRGSDG